VPIDIADWTDSVQANISPSVQATQLSAAGSSVVLLPDTGIFSVGDTVKVTSGLTAPPAADPTTALIQAITPDVSVTLSLALLNDCKVGDVVQRQNAIDVYDRAGRQLGIVTTRRTTDGSPPGGSASVRTFDVNVTVPAVTGNFVAIAGSTVTGNVAPGRTNTIWISGLWLSFFSAPVTPGVMGLSLITAGLVEISRLWNFGLQGVAGSVLQYESTDTYWLGRAPAADSTATLGLSFFNAAPVATQVFGKIFGFHTLAGVQP
jgi:hypothetical protein